jgi:hypothetical protein
LNDHDQVKLAEVAAVMRIRLTERPKGKAIDAAALEFGKARHAFLFQRQTPETWTALVAAAKRLAPLLPETHR